MDDRIEATVLSGPGREALSWDDGDLWPVSVFVDALSCYRSGLPLRVGPELAAFLSAPVTGPDADHGAGTSSRKSFTVVSVEADPR